MSVSLNHVSPLHIGRQQSGGEPKGTSGKLGSLEGQQVKPQVSLPEVNGSQVSVPGSGSLKGKSVSPGKHDVIKSGSSGKSDSVGHVPPRSFKSDIRTRALTGDELVKKMGKTPAWDRRQFIFFGKVTWQSNYKQTLNELRAYNNLASTTKLSDDPSTRQQQLQQLKDKLDTVASKAGNYLGAKHSSKHKAVMNDLVEQIKNEKLLLDRVMADPKATAGTGLSWGAAVEFQRHGVPLSQHARTHQLDDEHLHGKPKVLGQGAFNTVFKATYDTSTGPVTRVIKMLPSDEPQGVSRGGVASATGISRDSPRYGNRNIATSLVNDKLGLNVVPKSTFAMHEGRLALAMELAPGRTMESALFAFGNRLTESPKVQKQVNDLEWLDAIMGQGDRHWSNYLVDIAKNGDVRVTGIDNDQCAGKLFKDPDKPIRHGDIHTGELCGHNIGLPPVISKELALKLAATDFDRDIRPELGELLDTEELDAMRDRFNAAKSKAAQLDKDGYAIQDWSTWKAPSGAGKSAGKGVLEFLEDQPKRPTYAGDVAPSYLVRDLQNFYRQPFGIGI